MKLSKISAVVAVFMLAASIGGCGTDKKLIIKKVTTSDTYPIQTDAHISYWVIKHELIPDEYASLNDTPFAEELRKATGIDVQFECPAAGTENETFNLMIATNSMTDIIENGWMSEGGKQYIDDGIIYPLNNILDKVSPNYKKLLDENPDYAKQLSTEDGDYYVYSFIREDPVLVTFRGYMIRKDLLDAAGEEVPETLEELDRALYKFKEMGVKYPINTRGDGINILFGAFGIWNDFFVENGEIKHSAYTKEYQAALQVAARWYRDGILDKNYDKYSLARISDTVTSGDVGAVCGSCGGEFGNWLPELKKKIPEAEFVPMPYLSAHRGERPKFGQTGEMVQNNGAAITTNCSNVEIAARLLDFGYSEKGHEFYNFGVEGLSFDYVGDVPTYRPEVTDKAQNGGVHIGSGIAKYTRASYYGPFVQDVNYVMQYYRLPVQQEAVKLWADTDARKYAVPPVMKNQAEIEEYNEIMSDVNTYIAECEKKYINGQLDVYDMEDYYNELKKLGIERATKILQEAYNKYISN